MAQLRSVDSLVVPAVSETLGALSLSSEDAAVKRLAEVYARQLDEASGMEAAANRVLRRAMNEGGDDVSLFEEVDALRKKLAAHVILATIGPKLHDVLASLGATPKSRSALQRGGQRRGPSKLDQFRGSRAS